MRTKRDELLEEIWVIRSKIARECYGEPLQPAHRHDGSRPTKAYNQDDAMGFIRLNALRLKVAAKLHRTKK